MSGERRSRRCPCSIRRSDCGSLAQSVRGCCVAMGWPWSKCPLPWLSATLSRLGREDSVQRVVNLMMLAAEFRPFVSGGNPRNSRCHMKYQQPETLNFFEHHPPPQHQPPEQGITSDRSLPYRRSASTHLVSLPFSPPNCGIKSTTIASHVKTVHQQFATRLSQTSNPISIQHHLRPFVLPAQTSRWRRRPSATGFRPTLSMPSIIMLCTSYP